MESLFCCHPFVLVDDHLTLKIQKLEINYWTKSWSDTKGCCKHIESIQYPEKSLACIGNTIKYCDTMEFIQLNCWSISILWDIKNTSKRKNFITLSMRQKACLPDFGSLFISKFWHFLMTVVLTDALGSPFPHEWRLKEFWFIFLQTFMSLHWQGVHLFWRSSP